MDIHPATDGTLWLASYGGGLLRFDPATESFSRANLTPSLPSDFVVSFQDSALGTLWISTNRGLVKLGPDGESVTSYFSEDGLISNVFLMGAAARFGNGTLAFGGDSGVSLFDPRSLKRDETPPPIVLTGLNINGLEQRPGARDSPLRKGLRQAPTVVLTHQQRSFAIDFAAPHFANPHRNRYAFKLDGYDKEWTEANSRKRTARYTNLSPGSYEFKVRAANSNGVWNPSPATIQIDVLSPWWSSPWALLLYILGAVGGFTAYSLWQQRRVNTERETNEKLREVDRLKNEFLANTSHELRTPLFGMTGLAESLIDGTHGEVSEPIRDDLNMIVSSGRRLSTLVNDILDFSKLKDHALVLQTKAFDLHDAVSWIVSLTRPLAEGKELQLLNEVQTDAPPVVADENRFQQILLNLLGNAVKFTESGAIRVCASDEGDRVRISVLDTGIGIAPNQLKRIFQPFEQLDAGTDRAFGGTGLGLAITRDLISLHGGELTASSKAGKGSSFSFTLRKATASEVSGLEKSRNRVLLPSEMPVNARSKSSVLDLSHETANTPTVLIVDDEPVIRRLLVNQLTHAGYRVLESASGAEALSILEGAPQGELPNLVLLDVMMPQMSGFDACRRIRENFPINQLPVLYLTAKNQAEDLLKGFHSGANDFLSKPILQEELLARVQTHLELQRLNIDLKRLVEAKTDQVNTLGALLPICAGCKKVRDDEGYWRDVESFLEESSGASLTHGLCYTCVDELYPEVVASPRAEPPAHEHGPSESQKTES